MAFARKYLQFFDSKDWYAMVVANVSSKAVGSYKIISWALVQEDNEEQRIIGLISLERPGVNPRDDARSSTIVAAESHSTFLGYTQNPDDPQWQTVAQNYVELVLEGKVLAQQRNYL